MFNQILEPLEKKIEDNKMSKFRIIGILVVILIIFFGKPLYNNFLNPNSFSNWNKSDFTNRHAEIFEQVIEYTKTGDYDIAAEYLNDPKQNDVYQYMNNDEKYNDMVQEYIYLRKIITEIDIDLRDCVRYYCYKMTMVDTSPFQIDLNTYRYFIKNIASREDIKSISRAISTDFHEYRNNKGILYKYKLKMEQ